MFRDILKSDKNPAHFGVGSIITGTGNERFLVVGCGKDVAVVDLNTFCLKGSSVPVVDQNYMTEDETRNLVKNGLAWAFSDYSFDPKGLK